MRRGELLSVPETIEKALEVCKADNVVMEDDSSCLAFYTCRRSFVYDTKPERLAKKAVPAVGTGRIQRDAGALVLIPQNNQELLDLIIQAYRVCEDKKVLLPAIVARPWDMREEVAVPTKEAVEKFLPALKGKLEKRVYGRGHDVQRAMDHAKKLLDKTADTWYQKFRRSIAPVEADIEGADYIIVSAGRNAVTVRKAVKELKEQGEKVGFVFIRVLRPWFEMEAIKSAKGVAVIDTAVSAGRGGLIHSELGTGRGFVFRRITGQQVHAVYNELKTNA